MQKTDLLNRAVTWLQQRRFINLVLVLSYFIFIFFMHPVIVNLSVCVMHMLSLPVYNIVVKVISILLLLIYLALVFIQLRKNSENRWLKIIYLLFTLSFIIIHYCFMFEMNIEIIHIFEYAPLALLLFPLTGRFGAAVCFAIPLMLLDEWNQYVNLYPGFVQYLEFNDIILDIDGAGLAMVTLLIFGVTASQNLKPLWKRTEFIFLMVFTAATIIAIKTCIVALYEADKCANTLLVLNKIPEAPTFWRKFPGRDVIYHVTQPVESIIIIFLLAFFYFGLDSFRAKKRI